MESFLSTLFIVGLLIFICAAQILGLNLNGARVQAQNMYAVSLLGFFTVIIFGFADPSSQTVSTSMFCAAPIAIFFAILQIQWFKKRLKGAELINTHQMWGGILGFVAAILTTFGLHTTWGNALKSESWPLLGLTLGVFLGSVLYLFYVNRQEKRLDRHIIYKNT